MDLFEAIEKRHSYRGEFTNQPVPEADLTKIVEAGVAAPSGCNAQTTTFVIVTDKELLKRIGEITDKTVVQQAPALIVCVAEHREIFDGMTFAVEDCAAAVENILLVVTALGYASVWLDGILRRENKAQQIADLLEVPRDREVRVLLPVGVPAGEMVCVDKKPFEERAWFNRYEANA